jgi:hypothetical protein
MRTSNKMLREALERIDTLEKRLNAVELDLPLLKRLTPDYLKLRKAGAIE